jgi:recombination protein RecT
MDTKEEVKKENSTALQKSELSQSERFTQLVEKEFTGGKPDIALTDFQKRLAKNYFIAADYMLKTTEEKRMKKQEQYRDDLAYTWQNVNMELLVRNVVSSARIGLDPSQSNHINLIPYKNTAIKKYDIGFIDGYRGKELKVKKYGLDIPDDIIVELKYSTDKFKAFKKDKDNPIETYTHEITNEFKRGDIEGGYYYYSFFKQPQKNKLVIFSLADIEKRKPKYASAEFWGGEKDKWVKDETTGKNKKQGTEKIEGWFPEMCWKTIARAAYGGITIDSQKIDDDYMTLSLNEQSFQSATVQEKIKEEIKEKANREVIDIDHEVINEPGIKPEQPESTEPTDEQKREIEGQERKEAEKQEKIKRGRAALKIDKDGNPKGQANLTNEPGF